MSTSTPKTFSFAGLPRPATRLAYTYDLVVSRALSQPMERPPQGMPNTGMVQSRAYFSLCFMLLPLVALVSLVDAWYPNDLDNWMMFWMFGGAGFVIYALFLLGSWLARGGEQPALVHPDAPSTVSLAGLRAAVLTGNDQITPTINLPANGAFGGTAADLEQGAAATVLTVMPPERRLLRMRQMLFWTLLVPGCLMLSIEGLVVYGHPSDGQSVPWQILTPLLLFSMELLCILVVTRGTARRRNLRIEADGLHWSQFALPWSEMRGLCVLLLQPRRRQAGSRPDAIYTIFGQHASLTWYVDASSDASAYASAVLLQRVQSHTGLPLRDITPGVIRINDQIQRGSVTERYKLFAINDQTIAGIHVPSLRNVLLLFCLATLVLLAGVGMPFAQQRYFGGQLVRLESAQHAIHDPLTSNRQQWLPAVSDSGIDPPFPDVGQPALAFTPFGYAYANGPCCELGSRIARPFGNVLIEVTVRQESSFNLSGAGILFRGSESDRTTFAFVVTPDGKWRLMRFTLDVDGALTNEIDLRYEGIFVGIPAIHQGHDATNRLAVLMQGSDYTFYVNRQFVGGYHSDGVPRSGQVGVYTDGLAKAVTFSELLISPL